MRATIVTVGLLIVCMGMVYMASAQRPTDRFQRGPGQGGPGGPGATQGQGGPGGGQRGAPGRGEEYKLPEDPRLVALHKTFVEGAMKLAGDYERSNQLDKAKACYDEILRLVPTFPDAKDKLEKIREKEATAERKLFDVFANRDWQDTGIEVMAGRPVVIKADGTWTFKASYTMDANGIAIPAELRDFNLGALIGMIVPADMSSDPEERRRLRPFFVGTSSEFTAERDGKLFLRMYDADPSDNVGKVGVVITGTFKKK